MVVGSLQHLTPGLSLSWFVEVYVGPHLDPDVVNPFRELFTFLPPVFTIAYGAAFTLLETREGETDGERSHKKKGIKGRLGTPAQGVDMRRTSRNVV